MLRLDGKEAIEVEFGEHIKVLTGSNSREVDVPSGLSYVTFALFSPDNRVIYGGASVESKDVGPISSYGIILMNDKKLIKRANAKPILCKLLKLNEEAGFEIWSLWSDNIMYVSTSVDEKPKYSFRLGQANGINDFVVFENTFPEVVSWKRTSRLLITCGSDPSLACFKVNPDSLSDGQTLMAVAAASALTSMVSSFARKWFLDNASEEDPHDESNVGDDEEEKQERSRVTIHPKLTFGDNERDMLGIVKGTNLAASFDAFGRIFVFHPSTLQIIQILKGYRSPSLAFQKIKSTQTSTAKVQDDVLLILSPISRGDVLELWLPDRNLPFAVVNVPPYCRLAQSCTNSTVALVSESKIIGEVDTSIDTQEIEWDKILVELKSDSKDITKPFPEEMLENVQKVLTRMIRMDSSSHNQWFSSRTYIALMSQALEVTKSPGTAKYLRARLKLLNELQTVSGLKNWTLWKDNLGEAEDNDHPRKWLLELGKDDLKSERNSKLSSIRGPLDVLSYTIVGIQPSPDVFFDCLLCGDVFLLRNLEPILRDFPSRNLTEDFLDWWLKRRIETSPSWASVTPTGNLLLRVATLLMDNEAQFQNAITKLKQCAHGKVEIARAALLCHGMSIATKQEIWLEAKREFERAFRICVIIDDDRLSAEETHQAERIFEIASETCVPYESQLRNTNISSTTVKDEMLIWRRPTHPLDALREYLKDDLFSSATNRDAFRQLIFTKAIKLEDYSVALNIARDMEEVNLQSLAGQVAKILLTFPSSQDSRKSDAENEDDHEEEMESSLRSKHARYFRLLMFLYKDDPVRRDAVNGLVLAKDLSDFVSFCRLRDEVILKDPMSSSNESRPRLLEIGKTLIINRIKMAKGQEDDEIIRAQGRALGLGDELLRLIAQWHLTNGRDAAGKEAIISIANEGTKQATASDAMRICRDRLANWLKSARSDPSKARTLAALAPKTTSWLLSSNTPAPSSVNLFGEPQNAPLLSTHDVLSAVLPYMSDEKSGDKNSVSAKERCLQMLALIDNILSST